MNLKQFMIRQEVLKLYREILRTAREVHDESSRKELLEWARHDFEVNKHHTDEIKMLLLHGRRQLQQLRVNLSLSQ